MLWNHQGKICTFPFQLVIYLLANPVFILVISFLAEHTLLSLLIILFPWYCFVCSHNHTCGFLFLNAPLSPHHLTASCGVLLISCCFPESLLWPSWPHYMEAPRSSPLQHSSWFQLNFCSYVSSKTENSTGRGMMSFLFTVVSFSPKIQKVLSKYCRIKWMDERMHFCHKASRM